MGAYNLSGEEIADIFEKLEFESHCEGDFSAETFLEGAKLYLESLKKQGMSLPMHEVLRFEIIKTMRKSQGQPIFFIHDRNVKECNGQFNQIVGRIISREKKFRVDNK